MKSFVIEIPDTFIIFLDSALVRFQYLFPETEVQLVGSTVSIKKNDHYSDEELKRELLHLVYREKIYAETLDIRKSIYRSISDG